MKRTQAANPPCAMRADAARPARRAGALLEGDTFDAAVGELAAALLIAGEPADFDRLGPPIRDAVAAEGWHAGGEPPTERSVTSTIASFFAAAEGVGALEAQGDRWRFERAVTAPGRTALHAGLRARALGPVRRL